MLGAAVYRRLLFISVDAHIVIVIVIVIVLFLGVDGPSVFQIDISLFLYGKVLFLHLLLFRHWEEFYNFTDGNVQMTALEFIPLRCRKKEMFERRQQLQF